MLLMDATLRTKMMCFERKSKQNIRAAHFVYLALGAQSAPSDVGFAKDYKFRANSPPGADTWITGGSGCGPWCGLKEAFRNVSKKFSLCLMTIVHYIQCFQCCLGCFELHKKQKVKFPMLSYVKKSLSPALQVVVNMGPDADKRKDFTGASIGCFTLCPSCIWHFLQKPDITFLYMN